MRYRLLAEAGCILEGGHLDAALNTKEEAHGAGGLKPRLTILPERSRPKRVLACCWCLVYR